MYIKSASAGAEFHETTKPIYPILFYTLVCFSALFLNPFYPFLILLSVSALLLSVTVKLSSPVGRIRDILPEKRSFDLQSGRLVSTD